MIKLLLKFEPEEKLIMVLRPHWFVILYRILFWVVVALVPIVFYLAPAPILIQMVGSSVATPLIVLFSSIYYLYVWLFIFSTFVNYYLDVWIITNKRIVSNEQKGLFDRQVSELRLVRVQDVTSELKGFFSTMLNYGTVSIQTAGTDEDYFTFDQIPDPRHISQMVIQLSEGEKHHQHNGDQTGV